VLALGLLVALPVLYVLSVGPAAKLSLDDQGMVSDRFSVVYWPVVMIYAKVPFVRRPLDRWTGLWVPVHYYYRVGVLTGAAHSDGYAIEDP
jgi:hypothetical protein